MSKQEIELTRREGFWYSDQEPMLPFPATLSLWPGKEAFLKALSQVESVSKQAHYKGFSRCRICGKMNGSSQYSYRGWTWPSGYYHYIRDHSVRPSLAFQEFILGKEVGK